MKEIKLTRGYVALVDDEDFEMLSKHTWRTKTQRLGTQYALTNINIGNGKYKTVRMHRIIMDAQPGQFVDHRDGNGLNNQKENLRFCTITENMQNSRKKGGKSRHKGVCWHRQSGLWITRICLNKKVILLRYFKDEEDAARSYNKAALELFGEFASLNFITPDFGESIGIE